MFRHAVTAQPLPILRQGRRLEYLTVGWNTAEAAVAIVAASAAGSVALLGFGIDSVVESLSGLVLLWRLADGGKAREERALKLVGACFVALALYVFADATIALVRREPPEAPLAGIILAALSLIVMPLLAAAKRRTAAQLGSRALAADSKQTDLCAYLSAVLLGGLVLNALFGWWWADPVAALVMVPIIAREGLEALRGESCDCGP